MTQDEIIEMVRQAGFSIADGIVTGGVTDVKRFAKLVAEREREECAKVCDDYDVAEDVNTCDTAEGIAIAIRARGEA